MGHNLAKLMSEIKQVSPEEGVPIWQAGPFRWDLSSEALLMGVVNVTPDSFSDGGRFYSLAGVIEASRSLLREGAAIIDVGGESTRPGAGQVCLKEELRRIEPVISGLVGLLEAAISIDTQKPEVAEVALEAGAHIVNDVSGFRDPRMVELCAGSDCGIVVMHMKGTPQNMQSRVVYRDVIEELRGFFEERLETLTRAGIAAERIVFDPGIGFGKSLHHNLALIDRVSDYTVGDRPILMGLSRKSLIGQLLADSSMSRREAPTQALTALSRRRGAMIHRVHDVKSNSEVLRMTEELI